MCSYRGGTIRHPLLWAILATIVTPSVIFVGLYLHSFTDCHFEEQTTYWRMTDIMDACKEYKRDHNDHWPDSLDLLLGPDKNGKVYMEELRLRDFWDNSFQYDPIGPKHNGELPDLWTTSPDGQVFCNW